MIPVIWLVIIAAVLRIAFLLVIPEGTFSLDMARWLKVIEILAEGGNPYNETTYLNAAPFWMQFLFVAGRVAESLQVSAQYVIQAILIVADLLTILVLHRALLTFTSAERTSKIILLGVCLNPAWILLTCQHSQFDNIVGLFILLAVIAVVDFFRSKAVLDWFYSCLYIGLGILAKTAPFVLLPLATYRLTDRPRRELLFGTGLLFGPLVLALSVIYVLGPAQVSERVIGYISVPGYFGISGIAHLLGGADAAYKLCGQVFFAGLLCGMVLAVKFLRETDLQSEKPLIYMATALVAALPALGPGYGPQYLAWLAPLVLLSYGVTDSTSGKLYIRLFLLLCVITYIGEYALVDNLGAFIVKLCGCPLTVGLSESFSQQSIQVLFRLPLFGSYLLLLVWLIKGYLPQTNS